MTSLWISLYAGFLVAIPVILWQVWAFFSPAVDPAHARMVRLFVAPRDRSCSSPASLFGYFLALPAAAHFLTNYDSVGLQAVQIRAQRLHHVRREGAARDGDRLRAAALRGRPHAPRHPHDDASCARTAASATSSSPASPSRCRASTRSRRSSRRPALDPLRALDLALRAARPPLGARASAAAAGT